jgi:ribosome biogenesis GTPase
MKIDMENILKKYGYFYDVASSDGEQKMCARITAVHKERFELVSKYGYHYGRIKQGKYYRSQIAFPTVGDFVEIEYNPSGDSSIVNTLQRKSYFSRTAPGSGGYQEQAIAANFDYVFILQSLNHDFNTSRLERYLTVAWNSGAMPVVVLTKADLKEDFSEEMNAAEQAALGVDVIAISSKTGYGMEELRKYLLPQKTVVFLGSSGVGKSSLINYLADEELMKTNSIREDDSRGRHTTTHRQLFLLDNGSMVIDTPGMRELGIFRDDGGMEQNFSDIEEYIGKCKFRNCSHTTEPGCAIKDALSMGLISRERWDDYCKLKSEVEYSADKESYLQQKKEWSKSVSKWSKQYYKNKE